MVSLHKASRLAIRDFSARGDCHEVVHGEGMGVPTFPLVSVPNGELTLLHFKIVSPRMSVPTAGCIVSYLSLGELRGAETLGLCLRRAHTPRTSERSATNGRTTFAQLRHSSSL